MVICHALTGSADVSDWWGPLMGGPGRAFDYTRFFVVCLNSLGSPYGSASPVTSKDGDPNQERYGPEFPLTTIRDDVKYVCYSHPYRQVPRLILTIAYINSYWMTLGSSRSQPLLEVLWAECLSLNMHTLAKIMYGLLYL